jgi:hypothetical protein
VLIEDKLAVKIAGLTDRTQYRNARPTKTTIVSTAPSPFVRLELNPRSLRVTSRMVPSSVTHPTCCSRSTTSVHSYPTRSRSIFLIT